jgi:hypothetical protein
MAAADVVETSESVRRAPRLHSDARRAAATSWWTHYLRVARRPGAGFAALASDDRRLAFGALALASNAVLYTLVYLFLVLGHGRPTAFAPWLAIPAETYYHWNVWLLAPSMTMAWLVAGAVGQLVARRLGGTGTFEDMLAVLGFGTAIASWWTLLHDLATSFLGAIQVIDQRAYEDAMSSPTVFRTILWILMSAYAIAFVVYYARGTAAVQGLRRRPSLLVGALSFITYQLVFVIFNR